jgi:hypothetical protein
LSTFHFQDVEMTDISEQPNKGSGQVFDPFSGFHATLPSTAGPVSMPFYI